ncbi:MAG: SRPBCC family protein [Methylococcales bacterium]|jgi:hypothetical protein|nr:SRPBCC family protein [Methylococcales bacterium]MBT7409659.1 SRPBCC family protein [Methylococcales bacterium]
MPIIEIILAIICLFLLIYFSGYLIPENYSAKSSVVIESELKKAWDYITDFKNIAEWSEPVESIEVLNDPKKNGDNGNLTWMEHYKTFSLKLEVLDHIDYDYVKIHMMEPDFVEGTIWLMKYRQIADNKTQITIDATGKIKNPFFRLTSKLLGNYDKTTNMMLNEIAKIYK